MYQIDGDVQGGTEGGDKAKTLPLDMDAVAATFNSSVGSELCGKPFRWDQRLYTLLVKAGSPQDRAASVPVSAAERALKV